VYLDEIPTEPDQLKLVLPTQTVTLPDDGSTYGQIYDDGYYMIKALKSEQIGSVGTFYATFNGETYTAPEKLTIQSESYYEIDLFFGEYYEPEPQPEEPEEDPVEEEPTNTQPIANPGGPYYQSIGIPIQFDASASYDPDGSITKYEWNFGETIGATGPTPTHTYNEQGNYTITLKVTDNQGKTSQSSTYALITKKPNHPPNKPELVGPNKWTINTEYKLIIKATDIDNDTIQYKISWGDNKKTTTGFLQNGTSMTLTQNWTQPGIYTIEAYANDINNAVSETSELTVLINIIYVNTSGYLVDNQNDGTYDSFYSNITKNTTFVQQNNNIILIDIDEDGQPDQQYNILTNELSIYSAPTTKQTSPLTLDMVLLFVIFFVIIVITLLVIIFIRNTIKQKQILFPSITKPKPDQLFYLRETDKTPTPETDVYKPETTVQSKTAVSSETPDEQFDEIRRKIDEAILKNEQRQNNKPSPPPPTHKTTTET